MKRFRLFFSFAFLLAAFFSAHAQNQPGEHWARINDDKIDI
jgi:Skp family chaperone for outer membrane proteins